MSFSAIPEIPEIPEDLKIAAKAGVLTPFIGAGASRLASCPSWEDFAEGLLLQLVERSVLNHSQAQQIRDQRLTPRLKLSFVRDIARSAKCNLDYEAIVHAQGDMRNDDGRRLYRALGRLGKSFVTTNYDYWLDKDLAAGDGRLVAEADAAAGATDADRPNVIFHKADITFDQLMVPGTVIHLHGSLRSPESMVVTTSDYLEFYQSGPGKENNVVTFLRTLFRDRSVLFVGYGLGDLELLEYILLKSQTPGQRNAKHFILQPFYSHELEVAKLYDNYYRDDCGIEMLPFLRDRRDHKQLIEVAESLASAAPGGDLMAAERLTAMEKMLDAT